MTGHLPRWDHRSPEEWLEQSSRFERMAERFEHHPRLKASFSTLARDAVVRAKDGRPTEARVLGGSDWRQAQLAAGFAPADTDYFRKREAQERAAASRSTDPRVQQVHLELAVKYGALVSRAERDRGTNLRLVTN